MMKKNLMKLAAVVCCVMIASVFSACEKTDNPNNPNNPGKTEEKDTKPVSVEMSYKLGFCADMLKYLDITAEYYDEAGKIKTIQVSKDSTNLSIKTKLPAKHGIRRSVKQKAGSNPPTSPNEYIAVKFLCTYRAVVLNSKDERLKTTSDGTKSDLLFPGDTYPRWVKDKGEGLVSFLFDFDEKGDSTKINWK